MHQPDDPATGPRSHRRVSATGVIAVLALTLSLCGGALAAGHFLITSTKQIKPNVLKQLRGKTGPSGPAGPQGAPGAAGAFSASNVQQVLGANVTIPANTAQTATATCPAGTVVIGGGGFTDATDGLAASEPAPNGWDVISYSSTINGTENAWALCATGSSPALRASIASATSTRARTQIASIERSEHLRTR